MITRSAALTLIGISQSLCAQTINEDIKFSAPDASGGSFFGVSVAMTQDYIAIGAFRDQQSGAVYLFDATTDQFLRKLTPDDLALDDEFGVSVAISGSIIVVGAHKDDDLGTDSGSVYLFDATTGQQLAKLLPDDGQAFDSFGIDVAIHANTILIGSAGDEAGSAYLFDSLSKAQLRKLTPSDPTTNALFGSSVDLSATHAVVGALGAQVAGTSTGAAYVFDLSDGSQLHKLAANDGAMGDSFGTAVAIESDLIAVGAFGHDLIISSDPDDPLIITDAGAIYLYRTSTGDQLSKLVSEDPDPGDALGISIDLNANTIASGAYADDEFGSDAGAVYTFNATTESQTAKLLSTDAEDNDWVGRSDVAIMPEDQPESETAVKVLVGAIADQDQGLFTGSAYRFSAPRSACPADFNQDTLLDFFDISAFLSAYSTADPIADFNNDGLFDFFDISAFLVAYAAGCP
ncbi:MAG: GC-type dockerin domain-anchored protein [Phycisphaerales bacterium]